MIQDGNGFSLTGGALLAILLYGAVSLFITGPVVGERTIEAAGWPTTCSAGIIAGARRETPAPPAVPRIDCSMIFGWFGQAGADYCRVHGHHFENNPINRTAEAAQDRLRALNEERQAHAAAQASTRCSCAATTTLEARRTAFALYAGSLRLITPPAVKALDAELASALASPVCKLQD